MSGKTKKRFPLWAIKVLSIIVMFVVFGGGYIAINNMHEGLKGATLKTIIDDTIPLIRHWVWFYYLYFIAIVFPIFFIKTRSELWRGLAAFTITAVVSLAVYAFWRTEIIRPKIIGDDISAYLLKLVYEGDKPYNCFPSQHVAYSWTAMFIAFKQNKWAGIIALVMAILISLSTLFIKQHWFVDVPAGIMLALGSYLLVYKCLLKKPAYRLEKND